MSLTFLLLYVRSELGVKIFTISFVIVLGLSRQQRSEVRKLAKAVTDSEVENKRAVIIKENGQLYHNKPFYVNNLYGIITQGSEDGTGAPPAAMPVRVGDRIELKNINIRLWLSNKLDRPNVMYKGILFNYPQGVTPSDPVVWFTQTNKMLDRYNDKAITILDTFILKSQEMYDNGTEKWEHSYLATLNKSYKNKKVTYLTNSANVAKQNLGFAIVCYDAYGTLQTDNIASFAYNLQITFEDA